jgi:hypothetical protein
VELELEQEQPPSREQGLEGTVNSLVLFVLKLETSSDFKCCEGTVNSWISNTCGLTYTPFSIIIGDVGAAIEEIRRLGWSSSFIKMSTWSPYHPPCSLAEPL